MAGHATPVLGDRPRAVRRDEARLLRASLDALRLGEGRIVELTGDPGTGKTRLLAETLGDAERRGLPIAHVRCTAAERRTPYRTVALLLGEPPLRDWRLLAPPEDRAVVAEALARGSADPAGMPQRSRFQVCGAVRSVLEHAARDGAVVVLEDVHWADPQSLDLIDQLVRGPLEAPLLLVIVHRPRQASPRLRATLAHGVELGTVTQIELGPLTLEESGRLLGMPADHPRVLDLHLEAHGVPLYLAALAGEEGGRVPAHVAGLLLGEVTSLAGPEALVASAAAVLGEHCDATLLAGVTGLRCFEVEAAVDDLLARDILRPAARASKFEFRHRLLRQVVYDGTASAWRRSAHRSAARVLAEYGAPPAVLADQVERAVAPTDPEHLRILREAAGEALLTDPGRAAHWLELALHGFSDDMVDDRTRTELRVLRAQALGRAGRLAESRDLLHRVMGDLPPEEKALRASAVAFWALVECLLGNFAEALALLADGVASIAGDPEPPREAAVLLIEHGLVGAFDGRAPDPAGAELALRLARRHGDRVAESGALVLGALGAAFADTGRTREPLAAAATALDRLSDAELAPHPEFVAMLGWAETLAGQFQGAERHFLRGIRIVRTSGQEHVLPVLLLGLGNVQRHVGDLDDARRTAAKSRELAEQSGAGYLTGLALALESLTAGLAEPGHAAASVELAERALAAMRPGSFYWAFCASMALAQAVCLAGDPARCVTVLLDAGRGPELPRIPVFLRPLVFMIILKSSVEAGRSTADWAERAARAADGLGRPAPSAYARLAEGLARRADGDLAEAVRLFERAAELFGEAGMIHAMTASLITAACELVRLGRREQATALLVTAKDLARRHGAARAVEEAERWLARLPGDAPPGGPDLSALTDRERQIATIAATGMKTREIAAELSLSPRTVDVHLTRIYRKLNISSRAVLARLLARSA
ncbi:Transcriptional regulatory protein UhpA [Actinomadura rubteroloni]|uniref:Transcriptional regulatory protein UhpA n=1 Tax=Actinomadura rubteroloni TaxID=1926885 RepID=A0A2P4UFM1_9ACTN|nr:LuxR family transcriptional regulator [Actinomadura rubteroloni]POM23841.1 Transcriptional regulatory protein UhpA [Actinomadura rubteroloni]